MTVPTGSHVAILKLAGYDEMQADFGVSTNAMTTVSKRFSPGTIGHSNNPGNPRSHRDNNCSHDHCYPGNNLSNYCAHNDSNPLKWRNI